MNGQRREGPRIRLIGKEFLPLIIGEIASEPCRRLRPQFLQPQWPKSHAPVAACCHEPNRIRAKDGIIDGVFVLYKLPPPARSGRRSASRGSRPTSDRRNCAMHLAPVGVLPKTPT